MRRPRKYRAGHSSGKLNWDPCLSKKGNPVQWSNGAWKLLTFLPVLLRSPTLSLLPSVSGTSGNKEYLLPSENSIWSPESYFCSTKFWPLKFMNLNLLMRHLHIAASNPFRPFLASHFHALLRLLPLAARPRLMPHPLFFGSLGKLNIQTNHRLSQQLLRRGGGGDRLIS